MFYKIVPAMVLLLPHCGFATKDRTNPRPPPPPPPAGVPSFTPYHRIINGEIHPYDRRGKARIVPPPPELPDVMKWASCGKGYYHNEATIQKMHDEHRWENKTPGFWACDPHHRNEGGCQLLDYNPFPKAG